MNWGDFFAALALVLVIEGILPFINPQGYKSTMMQMIQFPDKSLRLIGLGSMLFGVVLLYLIRS